MMVGYVCSGLFLSHKTKASECLAEPQVAIALYADDLFIEESSRGVDKAETGRVHVAYMMSGWHKDDG